MLRLKSNGRLSKIKREPMPWNYSSKWLLKKRAHRSDFATYLEAPSRLGQKTQERFSQEGGINKKSTRDILIRRFKLNSNCSRIPKAGHSMRSLRSQVQLSLKNSTRLS